jgi:lipopolysaccharide heptosyltransferase I
MTRILIVRLGALGDILHALPAATAIRNALPGATIGWLVEERWSELLVARRNKAAPSVRGPQRPVVDLVHTVNTQRWRRRILRPGTLKEIRGDIKRLRASHYDIALDFQGNIKSGFLARLSKAGAIVGYVDPRESAARVFYAKKFQRCGEHVIEQSLALANDALKGLLGESPLPMTAPQLPSDPAAEVWADREIQRLGVASFAMVNPGAGWGGKQWPPERFGQVAQALSVHNLKTLVNIGPGEDELGKAVARSSGGHAFPITCTIGELIAVTRRARLFVGGDTGPLHMAAALGIPTVGLYGPTDPSRTGPFGRSTIAIRHPESETTFSHHRQPEEGLMKITVDEVVAAARHLLGGAIA